MWRSKIVLDLHSLSKINLLTNAVIYFLFILKFINLSKGHQSVSNFLTYNHQLYIRKFQKLQGRTPFEDVLMLPFELYKLLLLTLLELALRMLKLALLEFALTYGEASLYNYALLVAVLLFRPCTATCRLVQADHKPARTRLISNSKLLLLLCRLCFHLLHLRALSLEKLRGAPHTQAW